MVMVANSMSDYNAVLGRLAVFFGWASDVRVHSGTGSRGGDSDTDAMVASLARSLRGKVYSSHPRIVAASNAMSDVRTRFPGGPLFVCDGGCLRQADIEAAMNDSRVPDVAAILMDAAVASFGAAPERLAARGVSEHMCRVRAAAIIASLSL